MTGGYWKLKLKANNNSVDLVLSDRQTDRQTKSHTQTHTEIEKDRERERERDADDRLTQATTRQRK